MRDEPFTDRGPDVDGPSRRPPARPRVKRRPTIGDVLILISVLAVDFSGFRSPPNFLGGLPIAAAFIGLFVVLVVLVWLYVPRAYERICHYFIYGLYIALFALLLLNLSRLV